MSEIYVHPGEAHLVQEPVILRTVLGSCVGITFRHARLGIAALAHPMLPGCGEQALRLGRKEARRYVDFAIRDVAAELDRLGAGRSEIEVKLFGGADVLPASVRASRPTIGMLNSDAALRILRSEGFSIAASSLGGKRGVHIDFDTATGEVLLRRLEEARSPRP
jgi:chemotaxis protein CheD